MSASSIRELKHRHEGETICVVASGASLNHIDALDLVRLGVVVAVNEMWQHVRADFVVAHHHEQLQAAIDAGQHVVTSDTDLGGPGWGAPAAFRGDYYVYRSGTYERSYTPTIDQDALELDTTDSLVVSACTTSEALQFAAHLGAATILCCGIDGAMLNGCINLRGYNGGAQTNPQHLRLTWPIVRATVTAIRRKGIRVYSLSPFVGADHEGHVYAKAPVLEGSALSLALRTIHWQQPKAVAR